MIKRSTFLIGWVLLISLASCIGTDFLDDPVVDRIIFLAPSDTALEVGDNLELIVNYTDQYGIPEEVDFQIINLDPSILSLSNQNITTLSVGTGRLVAFYQDVFSDTTYINVIGDVNAVARVEIIGESTPLSIGDMVNLKALS